MGVFGAFCAHQSKTLFLPLFLASHQEESTTLFKGSFDPSPHLILHIKVENHQNTQKKKHHRKPPKRKRKTPKKQKETYLSPKLIRLPPHATGANLHARKQAPSFTLIHHGTIKASVTPGFGKGLSLSLRWKKGPWVF